MAQTGLAERAPSIASARTRERLGVLAIVLLALGWGMLMQDPGANQNAHLALVTALSDGSPRIDRQREWTADRSYVDEHYYAAKAPGLALATEPWYQALELLGLVVPGPAAGVRWPEAQLEMPHSSVWQVGLFGATLPALVLLLLVRSTANRLVPDYGTVAAVCLGAGSLLGVFATMFFAHALSACLGFAAFTLLVRERGRDPNLKLLALAGGVAGSAIVVEYPLAIVAVALGVYAAARPGWARRCLVYTASVLIGAVPLFVFNAWALGSPLTLSYANAVIDPGVSGHDVVGANSSGFFGVGVPSLRAGAELLLSGTGLAVITPLWALACAGLVVLWRESHRAEAAVIGFVAGAFLLYNASYYLPFGGGTPGPRFLVPLLPFLAVPLAAAWRAMPFAAMVLALVSIVITSASLVADPLANVEDAGVWFGRVERGDQVTRTVLWWVWEDGRSAPLFVVLGLILAACTLAFTVTPRPRFTVRALIVAVVTLGCWRIVHVATPILLEVDRAKQGWTGLAATVGVAIAIPVAVVLLARGSRLALLPALALVPLMWSDFAAHSSIALVTVAVALVGLIAVLALRRSATPAAV